MSVFKDKQDIQPNELNFIAEAFWKEFNDVIYCQQRGKFYQWTWQVYKEITAIDLLRLMRVRYPKISEYSLSKRYEVIDNYKEFSAMNVEEFDIEDGICFQNKYLSLKDLSVHAHDKSRINTILIPYDYDPQAQYPLWHDKITEIMENDLNKIKCIQEFFGYCLTRQTDNAKALFCIGEGATGKSTVLDVLSALVGNENVSVLSPRFYKDSMRISSIENKLVLMSHEISKGLEDYEAEFRQIVCGQELEANQKYMKPYKFKPFCKIILAMNEVPRINDHTSAFYRRVLPIEFNKQFQEEDQDKKLITKLLVELPGILNWSLEGLKRLREREGFFRDAYMIERIEDIRLSNNPIAAWAKEYIRREDGKEILKSEAYKRYDVWCKVNGHKPTSAAKFSHELYRVFRTVTKKDARQSSLDRHKIWPNLTWIDNNPITHVTEQVSWDE